jgi:hypothetical protein
MNADVASFPDPVELRRRQVGITTRQGDILFHFTASCVTLNSDWPTVALRNQTRYLGTSGDEAKQRSEMKLSLKPRFYEDMERHVT